MYLVKESNYQNSKTWRWLNFKIIVIIKYSIVPSCVTLSLFSLHGELGYFYVFLIQNKKNKNVVPRFFLLVVKLILLYKGVGFNTQFSEDEQ